MEEEEEEELLNRLLIAALMFDDTLLGGAEKRRRRGNQRRDRDRVERTVDGWTESMFRRQFRMTRSSFAKLRDLIDQKFPPGDLSERMARLSSGSRVNTTIRLYVTLRVLAGASYLDMVWYEVSVDSVMLIVMDMCRKITQTLQNVAVPTALEDLEAIAREWEEALSRKVNRDGMMGKTLLAGDGLVIPIRCPAQSELKRLNLTKDKFVNRKGCFAIVALGFCDSKCRFRHFEAKWPGSVNDVTAYRQTELYTRWLHDPVLKRFHMVLDGIFASIGGDNHLTPYSRWQLRKALAQGSYNEYRLFNNLLSGQRITIERAFGILVRRLARSIIYCIRLATIIMAFRFSLTIGGGCCGSRYLRASPSLAS